MTRLLLTLGLLLLTVILGSCRWDANALLGHGYKDGTIPDYHSTPSSSTVQAKPLKMKAVRGDFIDDKDCTTPTDLEALLVDVHRLSYYDTLRIRFRYLKDAAKAKLTKIEYKRGSPSSTIIRPLKCKEESAADSSSVIGSSFECTLYKVTANDKEYEHVLHSIELKNEKCKAAAIFYSVPETAHSTAQYADYADYSVYIGGTVVPELTPKNVAPTQAVSQVSE